MHECVQYMNDCAFRYLIRRILHCIVAPGETVTIAEEMAARDALRRLFKITEHRDPLPFGLVGHKLKLAESEQQ